MIPMKKYEGGVIDPFDDEEETMDHEDGHFEDMDEGLSDGTVARIMKARGYSKGGMVANGGDADAAEMADSRPNNFDDLALRDDLEFSYTGENSGDKLGSKDQDMRDEDTVRRIMRQRSMKQRNPSPT